MCVIFLQTQTLVSHNRTALTSGTSASSTTTGGPYERPNAARGWRGESDLISLLNVYLCIVWERRPFTADASRYATSTERPSRMHGGQSEASPSRPTTSPSASTACNSASNFCTSVCSTSPTPTTPRACTSAQASLGAHASLDVSSAAFRPRASCGSTLPHHPRRQSGHQHRVRQGKRLWRNRGTGRQPGVP